MPAAPSNSSPSTPPSLLQRLRTPGDADAWDRFARLYTPLLFGWARRAGLSEPDAADLVQETFAQLVRKLPEFGYDPAGSFRGWLRTVLLNKWRELARKRRPAEQSAADLDAFADRTAREPPDDYRGELVSRALALLRPEFEPATWDAFWQTAALGRPAAEAGRDLGLSANAVRVAKCRVLRRLRHELAGLLD